MASVLGEIHLLSTLVYAIWVALKEDCLFKKGRNIFSGIAFAPPGLKIANSVSEPVCQVRWRYARLLCCVLYGITVWHSHKRFTGPRCSNT